MGNVKITAINFFTSKSNDKSGDAILIECDGEFGLIDAGGTANVDKISQYGANQVTPEQIVDNPDAIINFLRSKGVNSTNLKWFVITHFHSDHAWHADRILREFKPQMVYAQNPNAFGISLNPVEFGKKANDFWATDTFINRVVSVLENEIYKSITNPTEGQVITLGNASFKFHNVDGIKNSFTTSNYNCASLVLVMTHGAKRVLFLSDSHRYSINAIRGAIGYNFDVVFASHHGLSDSTDEDMVVTFKPKTLIVTKWKTPYEESCAGQYQLYGATVWHMPDNGTHISLSSDGMNVTMLTGDQELVTFQWTFRQGYWYYLNYVGNPALGWQTLSYRTYFLDPALGIGGGMKKGWHMDGSNGEWYYLSPSTQASYYNDYTFYEGERHGNNWIKGADGSSWYWLKADGKMARNESVSIKGKTYNFDGNGVCLNP